MNHPELIAIEVRGHTDDSPAERTHRALSQRRAEAVAKADIFTTTGAGSAQPIRENATKEGRGANRRVELRVLRIR